jgi:hypothetical protein
MADRQQLHEVVEQLPASELDAALRYLKFLCYDCQEEEPVDAQTAAKLDAARAEGGQPVALEEIKRRSTISTDSTASHKSA